MAIRAITPIETLNLVTPGQILYADRASHPQQSKTGWNEAASSMNGLHQFGRQVFEARSQHINQARRPICGNSGNTFTEVGLMDVYGYFELPGGYTRLMIFGQTDNKTGQRIELYIDGNLYLILSTLYVNNFNQIVNIQPGQLANPGTARTVELKMRSVKAAPVTLGGMGVGYRDGLTDIVIKALP
jgi:hypothetical protein